VMPDDSGVAVGSDGVLRCWWANDDPLYRSYHDTEWGRPLADDRRLFEKICLEGFQSGLSWLTILRKRENFRRAFRSFDPHAVARFNSRSVDRLLTDTGIVRNRAKIESTIHNARRCLALIEEFGSLAAYVWSFEPDSRARPRSFDRPTLTEIGVPDEATEMGKDLKKRGWSFVGPTTLYAAMQSAGLVNDHMSRCPVRREIDRERSAFRRPTQPSPVRAALE
jgi:DNA-3-methyladenine glycosylase I